MKVVQITAAYKPAYIYGGPTMSVAKLCEALVNHGIDIEVLTTTANGAEELPVVPNTPLIIDGVKTTYFERITKDHTHFSPKLLMGLRKQIIHFLAEKRKNKTAALIIHIHAWWNLVSIFSCGIAKWYNIPVVLSPRGMLTTYTRSNRNTAPKTIIHSLIGKRLLAYCHIHATSEKEKQDILTHIKPKSINVIHNLVSLPDEAPVSIPTKQSGEEFRLLFLSRIEEKKGLEILFKALQQMSIPWVLTLAGGGDDAYVETLKQLSNHLGIQKHIKWVGHVDNSVKFNLLAHNDIMVLTSYNENFANVVIESLSMGTAVVISNEVGLASYVTENDLGWITKLTPDDVSEKLHSAYHDQNKRLKIRREAPKIIQSNFGVDALTHIYTNFYKKVIKDVRL